MVDNFYATGGWQLAAGLTVLVNEFTVLKNATGGWLLAASLTVLEIEIYVHNFNFYLMRLAAGNWRLAVGN
ncbi:MAG: hypothetical protein WCP85_22350 [Mariniphaga sp.]